MFDFIIVLRVSLTCTNVKNMFKALSEIVEISVPIPSQYLLNDFFLKKKKEFQVSISNSNLLKNHTFQDNTR